VSATETVKAIATASGYSTSTVGSAAYTITTPTAPTPTFSPVAGNYSTAQTVTISDSNSSATIYYTVTSGGTGTTPTTSSPVYTGAITVSSDETLEAMAVVTGYSNSSVATAVYTIQAAAPTFSPAAGSYVGTQTVTISDATSGRATIYYTTNGTTPTTSSTRYTGAITVSATETIKAIATASGYSTSPVSSAAYTITSVPGTPTFSPVAGAYTSAQIVTINDSSSNATIYYTVTSGTTGTTPTTSSTAYTGAISVSSTETLEAMAVVAGYSNSSVATATYTLPAAVTSTTALAVTSGGNQVTSVAPGSMVTLTATVASGATKVTTGTVNFCDATAKYCTDIHLLGSAQLTSAGTAAIKLLPGTGSHSYKAIFVGTSSYVTSSSSTAQLTVTGSYPTTTTIVATGAAGNYTVTGTVTGTGTNAVAPTGTVSFLDTTNGNAVLGTPSLSNAYAALALTSASTISLPTTEDVDSNAVVVGDFNGDGKPDLAVVNYYYSQVTILLGNGDGTFTQAANSPVTLSSGATALAVGDFNGDGKLDLAVLGWGGPVTILLGNGDGTFTQANGSPFTVGVDSSFIAAGDFNGDGKLDLAVLGNGPTTILLGNGDGTFTAAASTPVQVGSGNFSVVVGDFNGDGKPDLAVLDIYGALTILLGNGDGTFTQANGSPFTPGVEPNFIAAGDFNGDGNLDLAVVDYYYGQVAILLGNGDGTFTAAASSPVQVGNGPYAVAVGDFNGDGIPDLGVADNYDNTVTILQGDGTGAFSPINTVSVSTAPQDLLGFGSFNLNGPESVAAGDFNGNGIPDLAVVTCGNGTTTSSTATILQTSLTETATATLTGVPPVGTVMQNVDASYSGDSNYSGSISGTTPLTTVLITSIAPSSGLAGTFVRIDGTNFGSNLSGNSSVTFNGISPQVTNWTPTAIEVITPVGVTTGPVVVTNCDTTCGVSNAAIFTVPSGPVITGLSPDFGPVGTSVTVSGTMFGSTQGTSTVTFNGVTATPTSWGPMTVIAPVPVGVTSGPVVVTVAGVASNSSVFTVGPGISSVNPVSGAPGTSVTITGSGFGLTQGTSVVTFNGVTATPSTWSNTSIVVPVPATASTGAIVVTVGGVASNGVNFTVPPSIVSLSPTAGVTGTVVTVTGANFGMPQTGTVTFGGALAVPTSWGASSIVVPVPSGATTGPVVVTVSGQASNGLAFAVGSGTIAGLISNASNGSAISGAVVEALQSNAVLASATSAAGGTYSIANLAPGVYDILVSAPGYGTTTLTGNTVAVGATTTVNASLGSSGTIAGTVFQSDGVTPISGASLTALQGSDTVGTATTGPTGAYTISNLSVASYSLQAAAAGYTAQNQTGVSVTAGNTTTTNFSLSGQSTITYEYDQLGRLVGVVDSLHGAAGYSYDPVGNMLAISRATSGQAAVLGFTPVSGPVGTTVTIEGTGFSTTASQNTVSFNGTVAVVTSATATQLVTTVPTGAATGTISVTTPSGSGTSSAPFTVTATNGAPTITGFSPTIASAGTAVTIAGTNFDPAPFNDRVEFNVSFATLSSATANNIATTVPANTGSGRITVSTAAGTAVSASDFFIPPSPYTPSSIAFTGRMSIGGQFTGTIPTAGQIGMVLFDETAGHKVSVPISAVTLSSATVSIYSPTGVLLTQVGVGTSGGFIDDTPMPTTGTYTILIASTGSSTGNMTLTLYDSSDIKGQIYSGIPLTVTTQYPGQIASLTFTAVAGQRASIVLSNNTYPGCATPGINILTSSGTQVGYTAPCGTGGFVATGDLPVTGTYTVQILPSGTTTGSITLTPYVFNDQVGAITPSVALPGSPLTVTTRTPGQYVYLTFSATAGQRASITLSNNTYPSCASPGINILTPSGTQVGYTAPCGSGGFVDTGDLPVTGTYTVQILPSGANTGSITLDLFVFNDQTGTIAPGSPVVVSTNTPGQYVYLTFNATAGQHASIALSNNTYQSCASPAIQILEMNGTQVGYTAPCGQTGGLGSVTLPLTGTYEVSVDGANADTGSITMDLTVQ